MYTTSRSAAVTPATFVSSSGGVAFISETLSFALAETINAFFSTVNSAEATASVLAAGYAYMVYFPASSFCPLVNACNAAFCEVLYLYVTGSVTSVVSDVPAATVYSVGTISSPYVNLVTVFPSAFFILST